MENQEVYNIAEGTSSVTIKHVQGLNEIAPKCISIKGNIDSVFNWLDKRVQSETNNQPVFENDNLIDQDDAHLLIDRDELSMELIIHELHPHLKGSISGKLKKDKKFTQWNINSPGDEWNHETLAEFVKMNRSCFVDKKTAMDLSASLKTIEVKVDREVKASNDNRGNIRATLAQNVIKSSIPASFNLKVPIFKGQTVKEFQVEIYINPDTYRVSLISPDANDIVESVRDTIIDEQKEKIVGIAPHLVIIEK